MPPYTRGSVPLSRLRLHDDKPLSNLAFIFNLCRYIEGMDIFISVWNLHRSPDCWEDPLKFDPMRFKRPFTNPGVEGWNGQGGY